MNKTLRNLIVALLICSLILPMTAFASTGKTYNMTVSIKDDKYVTDGYSYSYYNLDADQVSMIDKLETAVAEFYTDALKKANYGGMYAFGSPAMQKIMDYGLKIERNNNKDNTWSEYVTNDTEAYIKAITGKNGTIERHFSTTVSGKNEDDVRNLFKTFDAKLSDYGVGTYVITLLNNVQGDVAIINEGTANEKTFNCTGVTYTVTIKLEEVSVTPSGGGTVVTPTTNENNKIEVKNTTSTTTTDSKTGATESEVSGGEVKVTASSADTGTKVTVTAEPNETKMVNYVIVRDKDGKMVDLTYDGNGNFTFEMPEGGVTVESSFTTAPATPAETGVSDLLDTDDHVLYMIGDTAGNFRPKDDVKRDEIATIFYRLLKNKNVEITKTFSDVSDSAWYSTQVNTLASMGILNGRTTTNFEPEAAITRAEFAAICVRCAKALTGTQNFTDVEGHWAEDEIATAASYGWITGYEDGTFRPDELISREEAATMVNRMLYRFGDQIAIAQGTAKKFPDVNDTMWSYFQIGEATNGHEYTDEEKFIHEAWGNQDTILHSNR